MRNFFKGISFTQIGAGALAAVTSFLLSAKIGVAGSVIGVAVGSVVAAVASQIYQNVFKASSEKIQNVIPFNGSDGDQEHSQGSGQSAEPDSTMVIGSERPDGAHSDGEVSQTATLPVQESGQPRVVSSQGSHADASHAGIVHAGEVGTAKEPGHGAALSEADQHRRRKVAIIVAVVSALLAVGLTSAIIMLATKGKGTDDYVRNVVSNSKVVRTPAPSTSGGAGQTPSPSPSSSDGAATSGGESSQHGSQGTSTPSAGATPSGSSTGGSGSSSGSASPGSGSSSGTGTPSSGSGSSTGSPSSGTAGGSNNESNGGTTSGSTTVNGTSGGSSNSTGKANTSSSKESGSATGTSAKGLGSTASGADSSVQPQEILSNSAK
ncbi:hypothetical protein [Bifidobacterium tibiigranuli]|uniref:hypothetical protein n=1 Tax=Bifidobacterium tibiigranuli TaxID=2172043 RepID=UPI0026F304DD|nr:hypothetical protein [Bifidobacterium tibiigranuli]MCI1650483.1 hypothetical protein [Bifidobacterium tibiigranuli]MCI2185315.1 hypothetical protein [Bifidobacterium tibiigranuli]MCI2203710.1 hypothetical protein [Bifidobacterium tibiigranuli]